MISARRVALRSSIPLVSMHLTDSIIQGGKKNSPDAAPSPRIAPKVFCRKSGIEVLSPRAPSFGGEEASLDLSGSRQPVALHLPMHKA